MKFLVTGITSFTSPHLVNRILSANNTVVGTFRTSPDSTRKNIADVISPLNLKKLELLYLDLCSYESVNYLIKHYRFDGVFHIAAFAHPPTSFINPILTMQTNAMGTAYLVEAISVFQPKCVLHYCSTSEVYQPTEEIITEDSPLGPNNPYAVSKLAAELYVREQAREGKIKAFVTRAFSNTGPRRRSIYSLSSDAYQIARILTEKQENEIMIGNMSTYRCVMDVRDVVHVYYRLMDCYLNNLIEPGEVFNISGNETKQMMDYLNIMLDMYNLKPKLIVDERLFRKVDIQRQQPDSSKVREFLGWKPHYKIEDTLKELVEYWRTKV